MSENTGKTKFTDRLQRGLSKFAGKMGANIYVMTIRDAMMAYVPFTFIASIFLILACFPVEAVNDFVSSVLHCETAVWQGKLLYVYNASLAIGGLLVAVTSSHTMAEKLKLNQLQVTVTALIAYLIITPLTTSEAGDAIALTAVSAQSMFCAILTGIFTAKIYQLVDSKNIKIKMPASVPPAVSAPFESLIPSLFSITIFWVIRLILDMLGTDAVSLINNTLGLPLVLVGGSLFGVVFAEIFQQILWFFGIHGSSIVSGVMTPILQVLEDQNKNLSMIGDVPVNVICQSYFTHFAAMGIPGAVIAALIIAKSKHYREIGKIAAVPYLFGVGEPALFGFPMMLNFDLLIPFVFTPPISAVISYIAFSTGLVPIPTGLIQLPWTTPPIVSGFLVTGSINGAILQLILLVVATLVWLPFIRKADRRNLAIEEGK
ncbi:MAG TPA: PTS transporter subunit EIIC [Candidatus Mediterraneibacter norfolkensis]|nr:PTS transporter subunit EIIC [Candidatus Mediterraneibacter norfolkensis]